MTYYRRANQAVSMAPTSQSVDGCAHTLDALKKACKAFEQNPSSESYEAVQSAWRKVEKASVQMSNTFDRDIAKYDKYDDGEW